MTKATRKLQPRAGLLALMLIVLLPVEVFGQAKVYSRPYPLDPPTCDFPQSAFLSVDTNQRGLSLVMIRLCFVASNESVVRRTIPAALGCPEDRLRLSRFEDEGLVGFDAGCELQLPHRGFRSAGQVEVDPILGLVKSAGARQLVVDVWVPLLGDSRCDPNPTTKVYFPPSARECTYNFHGTAGGQKTLQFSFGYGVRDVCRIAGILSLLPVMLIGLTLWHRRRAINAAELARDAGSPALTYGARETIEKSAAAFTNFVILGAWFWIEAIRWLHAVNLVEFLLPPSSWSDVTVRIVSVLLLLVPLVLAELVCFWLWSPVRELRRQS